MDERVLQLKELKKQYKRMRIRAGWGWRVFAWLFFAIFAVVTLATLFVRFNQTGFVQVLDTKIWEPFKTILGQWINYVYCWQWLEAYGLYACIASGLLWLVFAVFSRRAALSVKLSDTYRSWHTLKLTLETEKEESR